LRAREAARKSCCIGNLKQISLGLAFYSSDQFYSRWPDCLDRLYANGNGIVGDIKCFHCPNCRSKQCAGCYILIPGTTLDDPANKIVVIEKPGNHADGGIALYMDTHVKYVRTKDAEEYAAFVEALLAGKGEIVKRLAPDAAVGASGITAEP